ncbi:NAD-dependent epimerase/dehydratase family protein [Bradyrhizobium sp. CSA207]|uniref:NAD-dependent epimerase/dehydratase family protein n=1 Tax=Bradyrhizobium sp. CSA207 TaxID=2698826 RepID=UPI0023AEF830|nr:NAD(P)-dependent oxidoreductase [Bradyrhizobium sp. CSA207]MDE5443686.1 NAD-dependent epimerase/dehydratase family protein [Bradyrhizobium sp. CSA207]
MRIFVTGATGFLGSYVAEDLVGQGHDVAVLLRPGTRPWRLATILDRLTVIEGALDDPAALGNGLRSFAPDAVVHMAWRGVGNSERNSGDQARNIVDAVELAGLAADAGATIFVGAGSQAEYGPYDRAIAESDAPRPTTLYGIAKLASGLMIERRCAERTLRFVWLRIFSTYGPKDGEAWLIPSLIRTLRANGHMALTACEQRWGFLHARDAAAAVGLVLASPAAQGTYNLGSPDAPQLRDTVRRLRELIGAGELGFGEVPYRPDQVMVLAANMARLEALGWRPMVGLDQGLRETLAWHEAAEQGGN